MNLYKVIELLEEEISRIGFLVANLDLQGLHGRATYRKAEAERLTVILELIKEKPCTCSYDRLTFQNHSITLR